MKQEDFNFFKEFPNIEIRYEKRLHAKYYANESSAIMTSMNLYSFSQDNNIEAGVMTKATLLGNIASDLLTNVTGKDSYDIQAWTYFKRVIEQSELLYKQEPEYEKIMMGLSKKYLKSNVVKDDLSDFFANRTKYDSNKSHIFESKTIQATDSSSNILNTNIKADTDSSTKYYSATALSKEMGIESKSLNTKFESLHFIIKEKNDWKLTDLGKSKGGTMKKGQYGDYIAWPHSIINEIN